MHTFPSHYFFFFAFTSFLFYYYPRSSSFFLLFAVVNVNSAHVFFVIRFFVVVAAAFSFCLRFVKNKCQVVVCFFSCCKSTHECVCWNDFSHAFCRIPIGVHMYAWVRLSFVQMPGSSFFSHLLFSLIYLLHCISDLSLSLISCSSFFSFHTYF